MESRHGKAGARLQLGFACGEPQVLTKWRSLVQECGESNLSQSQRHLACWISTCQTSLAQGGAIFTCSSARSKHTDCGLVHWLMAATQSCLMLRRRGASPRVFSILPSPTSPLTGRILETWAHTDFHSHMHTHTPVLRNLVRLPAFQSMSQLVDLVSGEKPTCPEGC